MERRIVMPPRKEGLRIVSREEKTPDIITLTALRAGEQPFAAWSFVDLPLTQTEEHPQTKQLIPVKKLLRVPIKSVGLAEVMEKLSRIAPKPPSKQTVIKKDSPEGRAAQLTIDKMMFIEDYTDPNYIDEVRKFEVRSSYILFLSSLAIDMIDAKGVHVVEANERHSATVIHDPDAAIELLKSCGITTEQLMLLTEKVKSLTSAEIARVDQE